jgi:hypothetical protein
MFGMFISNTAGQAKVPRKATNLALVLYNAACLVMVLLGTPNPPSPCDSCKRMSTQARSCWFHVLYASRVPFFRRALAILWSTCCCLEHVLVRELYVPVEILQPGRLAKADELVVDEAILDVVELVDVLHNCLTLILYIVLDKSISADGNTKANVAVNHKRRGREQGTEVREGGIGIEHALCCSVRISRDTLDENLGLVEVEVEASVLLEYMLGVREQL